MKVCTPKLTISLLIAIIALVGGMYIQFSFALSEHSSLDCHSVACVLILQNNCLIISDIENTDYKQCLKINSLGDYSK